jgi:hypothetical protein
VRQFLARNPKTCWLPRLAIEPSRTAVLEVRSHISLAIGGVSGASPGWPIRPSARWALPRSLPRSTPDVDDSDNVRAFFDREEHAVNVRAAAVVEDSNWLLRVEALSHFDAASRI